MTIFKTRFSPAFTIVELLIVIVIIAILASITIVAYNGMQNRARATVLQSDLTNAKQQLLLDQVDTGKFPDTLTAANSGSGLKASPGTTYQYSVNNSASPQTFCLTATAATISYKITESGNPAAGGCPGHGVGGVAAITNLVTNPSFEVDTSGYNPDTGSPTLTTSTAQKFSGTNSLLATSTATSADVAVYLSVTLSPGSQRLTYMVYSLAARTNVYFDFLCTNGVNSYGNGMTSLSANAWTKISATFTVGGTSAATCQLYLHNAGGPNASGQQVYIDAVMVTAGSTQYNYADGNSPNWVWNGTPNNSTSTGPPQ